MSLIADGVLIVTCLTTAIYCYVLSSRLKRLSKTDEGIGQQIAQLNTALEETRTALKDIRASAKTASDRLTRETGQAKKVAAALAKRVTEADAVLSRAYAASPAVNEEILPDALPEPGLPAPAEKELAVAPEDIDAESVVAEASDDLTVEPKIEDEDIEDDEVDEALDDAMGAHQLGFLPEIDDMEDDEDPILDDQSADDLVLNPVGGAAQEAAAEGDEKGVMTVERVAL